MLIKTKPRILGARISGLELAESNLGITADELAAVREGAHIHNSSWNYCSDSETIGCAGEIFFADRYGLDVDREPRPYGDDGWDFKVWDGTTIDVHTARKPWYLLAKVRTRHKWSDILVLARYVPHEIELLGWETRETLLNCPRRDFGGFGDETHYLPAAKLLPMSGLDWIREPETVVELYTQLELAMPIPAGSTMART